MPPNPANPTPESTERRALARHRALVSAGLSLSLAELLRSGTRIPPALTAIADYHRQNGDAWAPALERIAAGVRDEGRSIFEAVRAERTHFTPRFLAIIALANLGGNLFKVFVERLRDYVHHLTGSPESNEPDFPVMQHELQEFCFLFGHLTTERASQTEIQYWLPRAFSTKFRLPVHHLLSRFFDQGTLLSDAFAKTPPFNDPEMILAIQAGEELNRVGLELLALAHWLPERAILEDRLRLNDFILPGLPPAGPES